MNKSKTNLLLLRLLLYSAGLCRASYGVNTGCGVLVALWEGCLKALNCLCTCDIVTKVVQCTAVFIKNEFLFCSVLTDFTFKPLFYAVAIYNVCCFKVFVGLTFTCLLFFAGWIYSSGGIAGTIPSITLYRKISRLDLLRSWSGGS
ncbi:hypothetical protein DPMN_037625 [Dreissena polymorpha]|uniref:Uncharacterized protein n=1 Tax=Dreissena polymorpha TaxID=45954 RepID=A0A9D4MCZ0_DREPO|nr:hypothetical protein DPMN_037625 [Dreissena polymorpha]